MHVGTQQRSVFSHAQIQTHTHLQVAVSDAKLGVGKPSGYVGMHLRVDIGIDADEHLDALAHGLASSSNVFQVKLAVDVDQHLSRCGCLKLCRELAIAIEDRAVARSRHVQQACAAGVCGRRVQQVCAGVWCTRLPPRTGVC